MRKLKLSFVTGVLVCVAVLSVASAQDEAPTPTPPLPKPGPAPYSLDLPDLHPQPTPDNGLFPNGPRQNPPTDETAGGGQGRGGRGGGEGGGGRHKGRARDQIVQLADADPLEVRVSYRRAKTIAMARDPGLAELIHEAEVSRTDVQKRLYLREYYTRLYASVGRIDPSPTMKAHLKLLQIVAQQRYDPKRRAVAGEEDLINGRGGRHNRNR